MILHLIQHGKGPLHAFRRREHLVDLLLGYAIGHDGPLQVGLGALAQAAFAGKLFHVEEVGDALRATIGEFVLVEGIDIGPNVIRHTAVMQRGLEEVVLGTAAVGARGQLSSRNLFQQALRAAEFCVGHLGVEDIPGDVPGFDLRLHLGEAAVVDLGHNLDAGCLGEGLLEGLTLGRAQRAAPADDSEAFRRGALGAGEDQRRGQQQG